MSSNQPDRLLIRHFESRYLVAQDHPAPLGIQQRLDNLVSHSLGQTLTSALTPWFDNSDASLWFIRQLDVELDIDLGHEQERIERAWAIQIARAIAITLQSGGDGKNVLYFPNRAAYLASFLSDAADNRAWSKWYYHRFAGLKLLPTSAVLRTAICEQPDAGGEALKLLSVAELKAVLRCLTSADAGFILDSLSTEPNRSNEFKAFESAWNSLEPAIPACQDFGGDYQNALHLYLTTSRTAGGGPALKAAALALVHWASIVLKGSWVEIEVLSKADPAKLYTTVGAAYAEQMTPLLRCPADWLKKVGLALQAASTGVQPAQQDPILKLHTPFGGIFLLLPLLDEWPLSLAMDGWTDQEGISAAAILRLLLICQCSGRQNAQRLFHDPVLRELLEIPAEFSLPMLADWQKPISATQWQNLLNVLTNWQQQQSYIQGKQFIIAQTDTGKVLLDGERGFWLNIETDEKPLSPVFLNSLKYWLDKIPADIDTLLLCDPLIYAALQPCFPSAQILCFDDPQLQALTEGKVLADILARLDKLPMDLAYLSLPETWGLSAEIQRLLRLAAQHLLRRFAWRLPGFAHANLPYLYHNFLDFSASLEEETDRRVVRISQPPLHVILNMTGICRGSYRLSWTDRRPFALFPEQ